MKFKNISLKQRSTYHLTLFGSGIEREKKHLVLAPPRGNFYYSQAQNCQIGLIPLKKLFKPIVVCSLQVFGVPVEAVVVEKVEKQRPAAKVDNILSKSSIPAMANFRGWLPIRLDSLSLDSSKGLISEHSLANFWHAVVKDTSR